MSKHGVTEWLQVFEDDRSIFFDLETDLLVAMDEGGNISDVNPAFEKVLGYSKSDVMGKSLIMFIASEDLSKTAPLLCFLRRGGGQVICQIIKWSYKKYHHYAIFRIVTSKSGLQGAQ